MALKKQLSCSEVAALLGCSRAHVLHFHGKRLTPVKDERGQWLYDREQVERLATVQLSKGRKRGPKPKDPGAVAREVFRLFALNVSLPQIVESLSVTPEFVRGLYDEWQTSLGAKPVVGMTIEQQLANGRLLLDQARLEFEKEKHRDRPTRRRRADE